MNIYDEHGTQVSELERLEPVEQDGVWYEAVEYRMPLTGETLRVGIRQKMTGITRYETDARHAKIVDRIHRAISEKFYAQDIKVSRG